MKKNIIIWIESVLICLMILWQILPWERLPKNMIDINRVIVIKVMNQNQPVSFGIFDNIEGASRFYIKSLFNTEVSSITTDLHKKK